MYCVLSLFGLYRACDSLFYDWLMARYQLRIIIIIIIIATLKFANYYTLRQYHSFLRNTYIKWTVMKNIDWQYFSLADISFYADAFDAKLSTAVINREYIKQNPKCITLDKWLSILYMGTLEDYPIDETRRNIILMNVPTNVKYTVENSKRDYPCSIRSYMETGYARLTRDCVPVQSARQRCTNK